MPAIIIAAKEDILHQSAYLNIKTISDPRYQSYNQRHPGPQEYYNSGQFNSYNQDQGIKATNHLLLCIVLLPLC